MSEQSDGERPPKPPVRRGKKCYPDPFTHTNVQTLVSSMYPCDLSFVVRYPHLTRKREDEF